MATLVKNPDTKFSTPVYAVASYGTSPEADSYKIDGLHVRNIYVNHKDAEVALSELNLQSLGDYSFERHHYQSSEIVPFGMTDTDFCAWANNKFGSLCTFHPESIMADLDSAMPKLTDAQKLEVLNKLCFSFGTILETNLVME